MFILVLKNMQIRKLFQPFTENDEVTVVMSVCHLRHLHLQTNESMCPLICTYNQQRVLISYNKCRSIFIPRILQCVCSYLLQAVKGGNVSLIS